MNLTSFTRLQICSAVGLEDGMRERTSKSPNAMSFKFRLRMAFGIALVLALISTGTANQRGVSPFLCGSNPCPCGSFAYRLHHLT